MAFISEFTNEIYDQGNAAFQDQGDTTRVFLGVLVTLLPKVIKVHVLKFIYSEKVTKFCEIFTLLLTAVHTIKSKVKISQNFVAFLEYMNFM